MSYLFLSFLISEYLQIQILNLEGILKMATKKTTNPLQQKNVVVDHSTNDTQIQLLNLLELLEQKVNTSPAFNGGFDTLLFKMEKFDEGQTQMGNKVSSIHDAIYQPDTGLFARVKIVEQANEKVSSIDKIEKDVMHLQTNLKTVEKASTSLEEVTKQISDHSSKLKDLLEFKTKFSAVTRWALLTIAGGAATVVGKILIDLIQGHITIH
jgi:hypothetical protein